MNLLGEVTSQSQIIQLNVPQNWKRSQDQWRNPRKISSVIPSPKLFQKFKFGVVQFGVYLKQKCRYRCNFVCFDLLYRDGDLSPWTRTRCWLESHTFGLGLDSQTCRTRTSGLGSDSANCAAEDSIHVYLTSNWKNLEAKRRKAYRWLDTVMLRTVTSWQNIKTCHHSVRCLVL